MINYVVLGTLGILLLAMGLVYFVVLYLQKQEKQKAEILQISIQHQRNMLVASVESQEIVRRQIGGDLHDDIGTLLSATRLSLAQLGKQIKQTEMDIEQFDHSNKLLNEAILNVRKISKDLMPSTLDEFGLVVALKDLVAKFEKNEKLKVNFTLNQNEEIILNKKKELVFFRIAQELINNSVKHANASQIELSLLLNKDKMIMIVQDNGVGFDLEAIKNDSKKGLGLRNIESRMSVINGEVNYESNIGKGTTTILKVNI